MVDGFQVIQKIREYLGGKIDLASFRQWVVVSHIEIADDKANADPIAVQLVSDIEGRYAEFSDELFDEKMWRRHLAAFLAPQSPVESSFFTYFYSANRPCHVAVKSLSEVNSSSNSNRLPNFGQKPESEFCPA